MRYVIRKNEAEHVRFEDPARSAFIWADAGVGAQKMSFGTCDIDVGSSNTLHAHPDEEEFMFVYEGEGTVVIGEDEYRIEKETLIFIPPGTMHQLKNTGNKILKLTWVYSPQGMEEKIRRRYR